MAESTSSAGGALGAIAAAFGEGVTLYAILGVPSTATARAIKKGYYKRALKHHPDRQRRDASAEDVAKATSTFQALTIVHETLKDAAKRKVYDETGVIEDEDGLSGASGREMYEHWRKMFPPVTIAAIRKYEAEYVGSDEEKLDVLKAYLKHGATSRGVSSASGSGRSGRTVQRRKVNQTRTKGVRGMNSHKIASASAKTGGATPLMRAMREEVLFMDLDGGDDERVAEIIAIAIAR
jgi:curved DNA-binding protein CbpA|tara:strand:- start:605 stop:1315 length:711 start_codon:yes stop_codon:yes gene_type:complete